MRTVRYKTRKGYEAHEILTPQEADDRGLHYLKDYKETEAKGDYILTDDDAVLEVLAFGQSPRNGKRWIRTCIGTFAIDSPVPYVDTEHRESRFTFSGKIRKKTHVKFTIEWEAFAEYLVRGYKPMDAYKMVYPKANSDRYASEKALLLMQRKEVKVIVAKKISDTLAELEIDDRYLLNRYKELANNADSDSVSIQALNALSEIKGIKGNKQVSLTTKVFAGIPQTELDQIQNGVNRVYPEDETKELTDGVKDDEEVTLEDEIY